MLHAWITRNGPAAQKVGRLNNRNVYRVPVYVRFNDSRQCATIAETGPVWITAHSAADAANYLNQEINRAETEVYAYGPKGGEVMRYTGWFSEISRTIGAKMAGFQLSLDV
jgi:hypothetical protein